MTGKVKSSTPGFSEMLKLLRTAWPAGFSKERNAKAWRYGGFGRVGVDLRPLWLQLKRETPACSARTLTMSEKKRKIAQDTGLADNFNWCVLDCFARCLICVQP